MSLTGQQRLELEAARREAVRLRTVRDECNALTAFYAQLLSGVRDINVQQLAAAELGSAASALAQARALIASSPDEALRSLEHVHEQLHAAITHGEAAARSWSAEQASLVALARAMSQRSAAAGSTHQTPSTAPTDRSHEALVRAERGDLTGARTILVEAHTDVASVRAATLDENIRREVVKAILATMKTMGFVAQPRLHERIVVLDGQLASGRRARFEVDLDGHMRFDLDGYEGRACKDDLDKVETALRDQYGVKLGPPQVTWKNPDRISKGALDLPSGHTRRGY